MFDLFISSKVIASVDMFIEHGIIYAKQVSHPCENNDNEFTLNFAYIVTIEEISSTKSIIILCEIMLGLRILN